MYINQLRLDSRNLSLEELERYSWLFGDKATHEAVVRVLDAHEEAHEDFKDRMVGIVEDALSNLRDLEPEPEHKLC